jgi:hypothetical protein
LIADKLLYLLVKIASDNDEFSYSVLDQRVHGTSEESALAYE